MLGVVSIFLEACKLNILKSMMWRNGVDRVTCGIMGMFKGYWEFFFRKLKSIFFFTYMSVPIHPSVYRHVS